MFGITDYTLAKRAVLRDFRRGLLNLTDICDAHPELMRAARNIGKVIERPCPVCKHDSMRQVRYVFGDELKELSGRPVYPDDWASELQRKYDEFRCYAIEVCLDCCWNHLAASYLMGRRFSTRSRRRLVAPTS